MSVPPMFDPELAAKIAAGSTRIERVEHAGHTFWIKRPVPRGHLKFFKNNTVQAFQAERAALLANHTKDLPIAKFVAEGADYIVLEDAGTSLAHLMHQRKRSSNDRIAMMEAAAKSLAQLHVAGLSHGRAHLQSIFWKDWIVRFIDLEKLSHARSAPLEQADDVIEFFFSTFTELADPTAEVEAARKAYIAAGGAPFWESAVHRMRSFSGFFRLIRIASWRNIRAIKPTLSFFNSFKNDPIKS